MPEILNKEAVSDLVLLKAVAFDFDGVFTDNTVVVDQNGIESVRCWRSDGLGLSRAYSVGIKVMIISTEKNPVVSARAKKLKTECIQGVDDKAIAITNWADSIGILLAEVGFVGNDINDIPAFERVGVPIGVADSYPEIYPHVKYLTSKPGGFGAVREVCDLLYLAHQ